MSITTQVIEQLMTKTAGMQKFSATKTAARAAISSDKTLEKLSKAFKLKPNADDRRRNA